MRQISLSILVIIVAFGSCTNAPDQTSELHLPYDETAAVADAVQHIFEGLAVHDSAMLAEVVLPDANFQRWSTDSTGTWRTVNMNGASFTSRLGQPGPAYLERTWEPNIRVDGDVAIFSAPYDFWVEQTCSHCGYDAITLLRVGDEKSDFRGWRIASLTYTVDASGEESCRKRFAGMPKSPFLGY